MTNSLPKEVDSALEKSKRNYSQKLFVENQNEMDSGQFGRATGRNFRAAVAAKCLMKNRLKIFLLRFAGAMPLFDFVNPVPRTFGPSFASLLFSRLGWTAIYGKRLASFVISRAIKDLKPSL